MEDAISKDLLIPLDSLFKHLIVYNQVYDIIPRKKHYGIAINFIDLQEYRDEFLSELVNTVLDWIYSQQSQNRVFDMLAKEGRTIANQYSELYRRAFEKFRSSSNPDLLHGQFGELLLFIFLQRFFYAAPILRKMPITTSFKHERYGADAIHYAHVGDKDVIYLGEAKCYTSKYKFNVAMEESLISILDTYSNHRKEIGSYVYDDFIDEGLKTIAYQYYIGELKNAEVHLVTVIAYNESEIIKKENEIQIKESIKKVIENRYKKFNNLGIDLDQNPILRRITYIAFPIWDIDALLHQFANSVRT